MPIRFVGFEWDDYNEGHIAEHNVSPEEVEECFFNPYVWKRKKGSKKRYYLYGQTDGGRYLFIVFELYPSDAAGAAVSDGIVRPISARDMEEAERRYFKRERRG